MKTIKEVVKKLDDLEATNTAEKRNVNAELTATREALGALREERESVTAPDDYKRITADIRDKEDYLRFLENKKTAIQAPPLSEDEYQEIKSIIDASLKKEAKDTAPRILEALPAIVQAMEDYLTAYDELDRAYIKALKLKGAPSYNGAHLDRSILAGDDSGTLREFILMYFKMHDRATRQRLEAVRIKHIRENINKTVTDAPTARETSILRFFDE